MLLSIHLSCFVPRPVVLVSITVECINHARTLNLSFTTTNEPDFTTPRQPAVSAYKNIETDMHSLCQAKASIIAAGLIVLIPWFKSLVYFALVSTTTTDFYTPATATISFHPRN